MRRNMKVDRKTQFVSIKDIREHFRLNIQFQVKTAMELEMSELFKSNKAFFFLKDVCREKIAFFDYSVSILNYWHQSYILFPWTKEKRGSAKRRLHAALGTVLTSVVVFELRKSIYKRIFENQSRFFPQSQLGFNLLNSD